jgi:hypothetical protein
MIFTSFLILIASIEIGPIVSILRRHEHFGFHVWHLGLQHFEQRVKSAAKKQVEEIYR